MKLEVASRTDLGAIRSLLERERLPNEDITETLLGHFMVCRDEGAVIGAVGLEPFDDVVLLRSLVVASEYRQHGLGGRLTLAAEELARSRRAKAIYLLTTTAEQFFAGRGYRAIPRTDAPVQIQGSTQFSRLCPATARVMVKP